LIARRGLPERFLDLGRTARLGELGGPDAASHGHAQPGDALPMGRLAGVTF
jgi:hypothetical protein